MSHVLPHSDALLARINEAIDSYFSRNTSESAAINMYYEQLWRDMHRLIRSGGKRLRPQMVVSAYKAFGGTGEERIIAVAAAQELLHMSLLIHDDVIDRDFVRYGVDNITGNYEKVHYAIVTDPTDRLHYAQGASILAGDLLIAGSFQLMAESGLDAVDIVEIQKIHSRSIFEVAGGELIDTESAFRRPGEISTKAVALYKTASYTFVGPLLIGATLAGIDEQSKAHLKEYAQNLGIAYQLRDDVIGVFGKEEQTGKPTTSDIREGKYTYMVEQFYARATREEQERFDLYFGDKNIEQREVEIVKDLLRTSGALARTEEAIDRYVHQARAALGRLGSQVGSLDDLELLITIVTKRDK